MTRILDRIRSDHRDYSRLLKLLERETANLAAGAFTDVPLLADIMQYFVNHPDVHHHPMEDRIFAALRTHDPNFADDIDEVRSEHTRMADASTSIRDGIARMGGSGLVSREELVGELREFIALYWSHMKREEEDLLGAAELRLRAADWTSLEQEFARDTDSTFDDSLAGEYETLYRAIIAEAGSTPADNP